MTGDRLQKVVSVKLAERIVSAAFAGMTVIIENEA